MILNLNFQAAICNQRSLLSPSLSLSLPFFTLSLSLSLSLFLSLFLNPSLPFVSSCPVLLKSLQVPRFDFANHCTVDSNTAQQRVALGSNVRCETSQRLVCVYEESDAALQPRPLPARCDGLGIESPPHAGKHAGTIMQNVYTTHERPTSVHQTTLAHENTSTTLLRNGTLHEKKSLKDSYTLRIFSSLSRGKKEI